MIRRRDIQGAIVAYFLVVLVVTSLAPVVPSFAHSINQDHRSALGAGRSTPADSAMVTSTSLVIGALTDNRGSYPANSVPTYSKFEVTFQVTGTVATDPFLPYTATPPPGVTSGTGITVDGELSQDNFQSVYRIPAFHYQDFQYEVRGGRDWIYPKTNWMWKVRFAPPTAGNWQYRIRATDASGTMVSAPVSFTAAASSSHGFVRVSPNDSRYFEYEDGGYFPSLGYNMNFDRISWNDPVQRNRSQFQAMGAHGVQVVRAWLSQWGIHGSYALVWSTPDQGGDFAPFVTADPVGQPGFTPYPGSDVAAWLEVGTNHALLLGGWLKASPAVKPSTTYRLRVRYSIPTDLAGPVAAGNSYGLVAKLSPTWLNRPQDTGTGTPVTGHASVTTNGWQILEGSFTTRANQNFLDNLYVVLENATTAAGKKVYIDRVDVEENLGSGNFGPNIVSKPLMSPHQYVDQALSRSFDLMLQEAEASGVTLKLVLLEKNDLILNHIAPDGTLLPRGSGTMSTNANFYGSSQSMTKVRWIQQAWWRYAQARWGYSTAIHSWELLNEGDPFNGNHAALAETFAQYMHQFAPNRHLATTSTWHSLPHPFWNAAPSVDYVDVHQYLREGQTINMRVDTNGMNSVTTALPADFFDTASWAERISMQLGATRPYGLGKPTMRGESGLASPETGDLPTTLLAQDGQGIWLHKWLWAQLNAGGLIDSGWWYDRTNIYDPTDQQPNRLPILKRYYDFVASLPLSSGRYVDSGATVSNSELRVRGQKDVTQGRAHLWIDNKQHTWKNVIDGVTVAPASGTVTIPGMPTGAYRVRWYDPYQGIDTTTQDLSVYASGSLTLNPPQALTTDIAVRIERLSTTPQPTPTATPVAPTPTPGGGQPTATATPPGQACAAPRPPVQVVNQSRPDGSVVVSIRAGVGSLQSVRVGTMRNASLALTGGPSLASGANLTLNPSSAAIELQASPTNRTAPYFVQIVVRDSCGDWETFFGRGQ